jgi:hypothetical protein
MYPAIMAYHTTHGMIRIVAFMTNSGSVYVEYMSVQSNYTYKSHSTAQTFKVRSFACTYEEINKSLIIHPTWHRGILAQTTRKGPQHNNKEFHFPFDSFLNYTLISCQSVYRTTEIFNQF